nr:MAG TPA: hypothetical protein [Caudoviricetes sp.]
MKKKNFFGDVKFRSPKLERFKIKKISRNERSFRSFRLFRLLKLQSL